MLNSDHCRSRAAAYRQLAIDSKNERTEGDMFEIASMFSCMAKELYALEFHRAQEQARPIPSAAPIPRQLPKFVGQFLKLGGFLARYAAGGGLPPGRRVRSPPFSPSIRACRMD
jgi:hypothetical protein